MDWHKEHEIIDILGDRLGRYGFDPFEEIGYNHTTMVAGSCYIHIAKKVTVYDKISARVIFQGDFNLDEILGAMFGCSISPRIIISKYLIDHAYTFEQSADGLILAHAELVYNNCNSYDIYESRKHFMVGPAIKITEIRGNFIQSIDVADPLFYRTLDIYSSTTTGEIGSCYYKDDKYIVIIQNNSNILPGVRIANDTYYLQFVDSLPILDWDGNLTELVSNRYKWSFQSN